MANQENNKWKEKLDQFPAPDDTESWKLMELSLDKHLPQQRNRKWLYAGITLLVLFLIIGICNYSGIKAKYWSNNTGGVEREIASNNNVKNQNKLTDNSKDTLTNTSKTEKVAEEKHINSKINHDKNKGGSIKSGINHTYSSDENNQDQPTLIQSTKKRKNTSERKEKYSYTGIRETFKKPASQPSSGLNKVKEQKLSTATKTTKDIGETTPDKNTLIQPNKPSIQPNALDKQDSSSTALLKDSTAKDSADTNKSIAKKEAKKKKSKWSFGTGLNYFFPINEQKQSSVNAMGSKSILSNFFPVIMGRYYLNERLYLQVELQLNAPQYTSSILIDKKIITNPGPSPTSNMRTERNIFTEKLFYVDVPLSLHVSLIKNVFIGGGFQYSTLRNAVGLYEERVITIGRPDSIISMQTKPIDDSLTAALFKKSEWRYNLNASFKLNRFDLGLRYTRAFNPFLTNPLSGTSPSKTTNSSMSIFLRYEFLRLR